MSFEKLAIIIPTKDRPDQVTRLLESISNQGVDILQIIVVDGGVTPVEDRLKKFSGLPIDYLRVDPPSLTVQRNRGIRALRDDATLVAFMDDDILLKEKALYNMLRFWETTPRDTAGAGFKITNEMYKRPSIFAKIFFADSEKPNRILRSGFQSKAFIQAATVQVQWLVGCAMVWRKYVFDEFMFDEWFKGYARYEEVDFAYRVGRKYKMFIVPDAEIEHHNQLEDVGFSFSLGKMQIANRVYFVKKHPGLSTLLCYWACLGLLFNNLLKGVLRFDKRYLLRAFGNLTGFFST